jgi:hypothetical protein
MARPKTHKDVEFEVENTSGERRTRIYKTFDEAAGYALSIAISSGEAVLDVLVWTESGARWLGGDDAVEQYREDPDASVFDRYVIKVNAQGRIA